MSDESTTMTQQMCAEFIAFGEEAVQHSAEILRARFGNVVAMNKGSFDVVTEADYAVESQFAERLARELPDHQMIGEEGIDENRCDTQGFCWVLDPLDGTVNYASGVPLFSVSLALLHDGLPQLAWVQDIVSGELFRAKRGGGATLNDRPLRTGPPENNVLPLGISSGFIGWALANGGGSLLEEVLGHFHKFRIFGSQALQLCYAASGRLVGTISREAKLWDDAAGTLIATECGRRYTSFSGEDIFPLPQGSPVWRGQSIGSVAGEPAAHEKLLELFESTVSKTGS
jgi:myo-inositol-1(or 4)-monophosphatase